MYRTTIPTIGTPNMKKKTERIYEIYIVNTGIIGIIL